jgi:nitrate reductase delta subunit
MVVLRALGALLTYPRAELLAALPEIHGVLASSPLLDAVRRQQLQRLIAELSEGDPLDLEQHYVSLFDTGRATCLWLFEHVHGESRDRGQAMVDLKGIYERAGFHLAANELPDYLPAVLEYLSYRELTEARDMLGDCAHILRKIGERLASRGSPYAAVFDALLVIAAQPGLELPPATVTEAASPRGVVHVDDDWIEPPAFGPGSSDPAAERSVVPLRFMPRKARREGTPP